ncbi:MAG: flagellin [Oscillospiraceae bacterium]
MGMIVQHNMNALNAYNKLNTNVAGLKKSSEKLSSGYRINRAGDDAAGLAISEKMRSQIRGLNQAKRNAQDGISMIQTYEGAAQETHNILQRMKELAAESANGTYDNTTDRDAIQLEFDQLNDELNQIADTDFNGRVALNGGTMADGTVVNNSAQVAVHPTFTISQNSSPAGTMTYSGKVKGAIDAAGNGTLNVDGVSIKVKAGATEADVVLGDTTYKVADLAVDQGIVNAGKITATTTYKINEDTTSITINGTNYTVAKDKLLDSNGDEVSEIDGATVTVTEGDNIKIEQEYEVQADGTVQNKAGDTVGEIDYDQGVSKSNAYEHGTANLTYADSITLQVGARSKDAVDFNFSYVTSGIGDLKADLDISARGLGTDQLSLATQEDANAAIDRIDNAINKTSMVRATFGAMQNRLEHKIENLTTTSENLTEAEAGIRDTDMASEMMSYTKYNILQQAAQSMLAQANQQPQSILQLLG